MNFPQPAYFKFFFTFGQRIFKFISRQCPRLNATRQNIFGYKTKLMVVDLNAYVLSNLFNFLHEVKLYLSFRLFKCAERKSG